MHRVWDSVLKERLVTGMLLMQDLVVDGKEYLVMDSMSGFMPGPAAVRLLAHRREGVGADRVLVRTGRQADAFAAFDADGKAGKLSAADRQILLLCASGHLGHAVSSCEMRVTEYFVQRMREADIAEEQFLAS